MRYQLAVLIGRFQPFHLGHLHALQEGLKLADRVLVLIGSAYQPSTIKNPWSFDDRVEMIRDALTDSELARTSFDFLRDNPYNDQEWIEQVQSAVGEWRPDDEDVVLIGHEKDESSFYLKCFPQWKLVDTGYEDLQELNTTRAIDATELRKFFFENRMQYAIGSMHPKTLEVVARWERENIEEAQRLREEYRFVENYKKSWAGAPYAPTFVTTDAVVVQSGHVLMVKRGDNPGKGLWALPGGFLDANERIQDCAIRELQEETQIALQRDTLLRCISGFKVFDSPGRSTRGRTITHAYLFKLNDANKLPKVKGADDAAEAAWIPLAKLDPIEIYEDHYSIIRSMLNI